MLAARGALNFKIPIHAEAGVKFYRRWNLRLNLKFQFAQKREINLIAAAARI